MQHLKNKIKEFVSLPKPLQPYAQAHSSHILVQTQICTEVMFYMRGQQTSENVF